MLVMPANNTKWQVHYWQGKFGSLGHLYSIGGSLRGPYPHLPYALDNGRFPAWSSGKEWSEAEYFDLLAKVRTAYSENGHQKPLWALVPDVVADKDATMAEWDKWASVVRHELPGVCLAFAAQDGMTPDDVPADAEVVFLGGSDDFKRPAIAEWCKVFPRVHVGRINTYKWLVHCYESGAESCDGTGWFRGDKKQLAGLEQFLYEQAYSRFPQQENFLHECL
jgi:hypothetical protein